MTDLNWRELGATLKVPPQVHSPSAFSAVLASALPDLSGKVVIDAGSGAGLITISALSHGAQHVVACDFDAQALSATRRNVELVLGAAALDRLSLFQADFRHLSVVRADIVLANPPQRPEVILDDVEPEDRHLHEGGGVDGLETLRLLLDSVESAELWTTAAGVLPIDEVATARWHRPTRVYAETVPMHPAWVTAGSSLNGDVGVWVFERDSR